MLGFFLIIGTILILGTYLKLRKADKLKNIVFCASGGGHYAELMQLKTVIDACEGIVITEKTGAVANTDGKIYYVPYSSRTEGFKYAFKFFRVCMVSLGHFVKFFPKTVISTGAHSTIPLCFLAWLFRRKIIYIETIAVITKPTLTGKLMYKIADVFYVQWEELLEVYPKAIYGGVLL